MDDGSTDGSLTILKDYERKDARVKILQQEHQYAGAARNNGLAVARLKHFDVKKDILPLNDKMRKIEQKNKQLNKNNTDLTKSLSLRIGRALSFVPRKLRDLMKS